jgi:hypothetical protein
MMEEGVTQQLKAARSYEEAYRILRTYPIHGEFIATQHLTDLNYSPVINFDEDDGCIAQTKIRGAERHRSESPSFYLHGISFRDEVRTFSGSFRARRYVPAYTF